MKTSNKNHEKQLIVKSRTENLSIIRDFISQEADSIGFDRKTVDNIILAVDEACTNIIKHAYKSFPEGEIIINLSYKNNKFNIEIIDYGNSFKPDVILAPDINENYKHHKVGGLGMYLIKSLMDEVKYNSVPGKYNRVLLSKNLNVSA